MMSLIRANEETKTEESGTQKEIKDFVTREYDLCKINFIEGCEIERAKAEFNLAEIPKFKDYIKFQVDRGYNFKLIENIKEKRRKHPDMLPGKESLYFTDDDFDPVKFY